MVWFMTIFLFSNQTGRESSKVSDKVTRGLLETVKGYPVTNIQVDNWELYVRKSAHFALFTVGGFVIYLIAECYLKLKNKILFSIFFGMLIACFDEFHQLYSVSRGPSFFDVKLDTFGVICGVLAAFVAVKIGRKIHKKYKGVKQVYDKLQTNHSKKNCKSG